VTSSRPGHPSASRIRRGPGVAAAVVLAALVSLAGLFITAGTAQASSCGGPLADGEIRVVVVVDPGDSGSGGPGATCMVVPVGTTGSQVLARRAGELGMSTPRYGGSGLLCAIDGYPETGCGDHNAGGFSYWAYFNGTSGSWSYGSYNPFIRRMSDGDIEGWRFVDGTGTGQDPPPRISPSRALFPALAPAPVPAPAAGVPGAASSTGGGGQGPSGGTFSSPDPAAIDTTTDSSLATIASTSPTAEDVAVEDVALAASTNGASTTGRWIGVALVVALVLAFAVGAIARTRRSV
jgi:hypothetical protein